MTNEERKAALEAIIYAADEPAPIEQLAGALGEEKLVVQAALDELVAGYAAEDRGIEIRAVAGGYKLYTKPQHHDVVRRFIKSLRPPLRLSMPALETLAVIAYKQPSPRRKFRNSRRQLFRRYFHAPRSPPNHHRRPQRSHGPPDSLQIPKEFLMRFGLSDLDELPSLKEFEALAREALGNDAGVTVGTQTRKSCLTLQLPTLLKTCPCRRSPAAEKELIEEEVAATTKACCWRTRRRTSQG